MAPACASVHSKSVGHSRYRVESGPPEVRAIDAQVGARESSWRIGPVTIPGNQAAYSVRLEAEQSTFEVNDDGLGTMGETVDAGDVNFRSTTLIVGYARSGLSIEGLIGSAEFEDSDSNGASVDDGLSIGARGGWSRMWSERWAWGFDASLITAKGDVQSSVVGSHEAEWFQSDLRFGCAYLPSDAAVLAVSPLGMIGLRYLDGVQRVDKPFTGLTEFAELDATLVYLGLGASGIWRPSESLQVELDIQLMLGDLQGLSWSLHLYH